MALDHPTDALPPGYLLDRYEILRVLGRGGFGVTYAARGAGRTGEMVAIKELFPWGMCARGRGGQVFAAHDADRQELEEISAMFCREAKVICGIQHPNLVRGIESLAQNNTGYLVMAYVSGKNLHEHLRSRGGDFGVTPYTMVQLCQGILSALEALHKRGVCHCDIKPDNIFLGIGFEPILIDLGSACLPVHSSGNNALTYSRHYSAIEQVDPEIGSVGPWTDIYQFAAVLYRCLTGGKLPDAVDRVASSIDPYVPLTEVGGLASGFPKGFLEAIDAGLERFPGDRPKSIAQWRRRLDTSLRRMAQSVGGKRERAPLPRAAQFHSSPSSSPPPVEATANVSLQGPSPKHEHESTSNQRRETAQASSPADPLITIGFWLVAAVVILFLLTLGKGCGS